tara:strand:- start:109 stop:396 length:288 start_codon:yes stop_codon:yes gene_type:complete
MKRYDSAKHYRSSSNFTTCYTPLPRGKGVVMSVGTYGLESMFRKPDGDGKVFDSIEDARQFAVNKGYLVEYDPKEETKKAIEHQNNLNKQKAKNV